MATTLRAFLMLRANGEWTVGVHGTLEGVLSAWQSRSTDTVGVLHVGFFRPPSQAYEALASRFADRMLLTESAKSSLPDGFQASRKPLAVIAGLPVYLGLSGWDYLIEDVDLEPEVKQSVGERRFEGWLAEYVDTLPEHESVLAQANIYTDREYLENESSLSTKLRHDLGIERVRLLIKQSKDDPCEIARAAPPWLAERSFDSIDLSVRASNVFVTQKISKVSDLASWNAVDLLRLPNFGRTSMQDVCQGLMHSLNEGPTPLAEASVGGDEAIPGLLVGVRRALLKFPDRERDIVSRRMGLDMPFETLQQIADDYHVTRERVRQIESKAVQRLMREAYWDDILKQKLRTHLSDRHYPLPVRGIEAIDGWFEGAADATEALRYLIANICPDEVGLVNIDGIEYFSRMDQARWDAALLNARKLLQSGVGKQWTEESCRSVVENLLENSCREFRPLLWEKASTLCHFTAGEDEQAILTSYGRGADHVVEAILNDSDQPLHFTTIAALASDRAGRSIDVRRAHNAAQSVGYLLGRGTYGVDRHLPDIEALERIAVEAEEVVTSNPDRQWHVSEIFSAIVENSGDQMEASSTDKYIIDIALQRSKNLTRLGRMVWCIPDAADETLRIDIRQAIIALIEQAGRPLKTNEIRQRLIALRGVSDHFQISATDPLLRVGIGLWGLNDRDVVVKKSDQPRLLDGLVGILRQRGAGIHISELEKSNFMATSGMSAQALFSITACDDRLNVNSGQYLYLREWGTPRRESVSEAVKFILSNAVTSISIEEIHSQVEQRIRRSCERISLVNCLRAIEAEWDAANGRWSAPSATADEESTVV